MTPVAWAQQAASSGPSLDVGIRQVQEGEYDKAVLTLDAFVLRYGADETRGGDLWRAHLYLGVAYVGLDQPAAARERFKESFRCYRLQAQREGRPVTEVQLGTFGFSPKITQLYAEATREVLEREKKGASKAPIIVIGVVAAAGAGGALVLRSGGSGSAPAAVPDVSPPTFSGNFRMPGPDTSPTNQPTSCLNHFLNVRRDGTLEVTLNFPAGIGSASLQIFHFPPPQPFRFFPRVAGPGPQLSSSTPGIGPSENPYTAQVCTIDISNGAAYTGTATLR